MVPEVIIIDSTPSKTSAERLKCWTKVMFLLQFSYFTYRVVYFPSHWIQYLIFFTFCGIYIPSCVYKSSKTLNRNKLTQFIGVQCFLSITTTIDIVFILLNLEFLHNACEQCHPEFQQVDYCRVDIRTFPQTENTIVIAVEDCRRLTSITRIVLSIFLRCCIVCYGLWSIVMTRQILHEKNAIGHLIDFVPDIEQHQIDAEIPIGAEIPIVAEIPIGAEIPVGAIVGAEIPIVAEIPIGVDVYGSKVR